MYFFWTQTGLYIHLIIKAFKILLKKIACNFLFFLVKRWRSVHFYCIFNEKDSYMPFTLYFAVNIYHAIRSNAAVLLPCLEIRPLSISTHKYQRLDLIKSMNILNQAREFLTHFLTMLSLPSIYGRLTRNQLLVYLDTTYLPQTTSQRRPWNKSCSHPGDLP